MLNYQDRKITLRLIWFAFISGIVVQLGLVGTAIWHGTLTAQVMTTLLNGGVIGISIVAMRKIAEKEFLEKEILPFDRLHQFASARSGLVNQLDTGNVYAVRRSLIEQTLQLAETTIRGWCPGSHFELCVFVDSDHPLLFSYFDSNRDNTARSMAKRANQPTFYLDNNYEVTKLLRNPTSRPLVIDDTHSKRSTYEFTTPEQKKQVRSTILLCIDIETPCALVITSDHKNAFPLQNEKLLSFIRFIANLVKFDLFDGDFIKDLKSFRPDLFPPIDGRVVEGLTPPLVSLAPPDERPTSATSSA